MTGFGFHAAPPAGHWINDPNALIFAGGRHRLFVQHRADAPAFVATGWARLSSDDLLSWEWDGEVLPPNREGFAYSGSITERSDGVLEAWHTRHRPDDDPRERQFVAQSTDAGRNWTEIGGPLGTSGTNARDPFVFESDGVRHMLLARPCDWNDPSGISNLEMRSEQSIGFWGAAAALSLDIPQGLICEVPNLVAFGDCWALIASFVDRRDGGARSHVGYWTGRLESGRFQPDRSDPRRLDYGPDFYAAIVNVPNAGFSDRLMLGWASSWATARSLELAGGGRGGAISMPRAIALADGKLGLRPWHGARMHARHLRWEAGGKLVVQSDVAVLEIDLKPGHLAALRHGPTPWGWSAAWDDCRIANAAVFFFDNGLFELFADGVATTVMLPGVQFSIEWREYHR